MMQTQKNGEKPHFGPNLASSVTRYYCQLSSCTISEKINDPVNQENLVTDGRTDGRTDRQVESDSI